MKNFGGGGTYFLGVCLVPGEGCAARSTEVSREDVTGVSADVPREELRDVRAIRASPYVWMAASKVAMELAHTPCQRLCWMG
jgi:hypothetical protein